VEDQTDAIDKARRFADMAYTTAMEAITRGSQGKLAEARSQLASQGLSNSSAMARTAAQIYAAQVKALVQARLDGLLEGYDLYDITLDEALVNRTVDELMGLADTMIINAAKTSAATNNSTLPSGHFPELVRSECGVSRASVRVQIERRRLMREKKEQPSSSVTNVYHVHGNNPRWNVNSADHSVNVMTTSHEQIFSDLRTQITSGLPAGDEQKDILEKLSALEQEKEARPFAQRYSEFISVAANHMALIAPFIPALTEMLQKTL
jgi:hypothetical protein